VELDKQKTPGNEMWKYMDGRFLMKLEKLRQRKWKDPTQTSGLWTTTCTVTKCK